MAVELTAEVLKRIRYECSRCKTLVREFDNLGQWECSKIFWEGGVKYSLPCDHGPVFEGIPELIIPPRLAVSLPEISNRKAIELRRTIPPNGNGETKEVIVVHRYLKNPKIHSTKFLNFNL